MQTSSPVDIMEQNSNTVVNTLTAPPTDTNVSTDNLSRATDSQDNIMTINSRFGVLSINTNNAICFEHGLLGIPGTVNFCLTQFPNNEHQQFKLFQCLEDHELCFIVVPASYDNQLISLEDINEACNMLEVKKEDILMLFIVSSHEEDKVKRLSVNAKAPIIINYPDKSAVQYVFQNPQYAIRHMIS